MNLQDAICIVLAFRNRQRVTKTTDMDLIIEHARQVVEAVRAAERAS